uniref:Peptidase A2 domain-containing protein n=1 Tax=Cacopsylla melanoneura TaxID=428564 RepID=A0A8D9F9I1_9HEMI
MNHLSQACFKRTQNQNQRKFRVRTVNESDDNESSSSGEFLSLSQINKVGNTSDEWTQEFTFKHGKILFKLDSGADCNVLPRSYVDLISSKLIKKMKPSNVRLQAYGGHNLEIIGKVDIKIKNKDQTHCITFHVMNNSRGVIPILGKDACVQLGLVKRIHEVVNTKK